MKNLKRYFWLSLGLIFILSLNTILTKEETEDSLIYYNGTFRKMNVTKVQKGTSYSLTLNEISEPFKIGGSFISCFNFTQFDQRIYPGDSLKIGIAARDGLMSKGTIGFVGTQRHSFFDLDCRNEKVQSVRISNLTMTFSAVLIATVLFFYLRKKKPV